MKEIKLNKLKETIYYDKCDNGLEIYMWVKESSNYYYATFSTRFGSVDTSFKINGKEYNVNNGIAHFLEHINFNESDGSLAEDYFTKKGTAVNAFTTYNVTSYEIYGSSDIYEDVGHLLDFVQDKCITNDIVENEKQIIIEELNMDKSNMNRKMYYEENKAIYHNNKKKYEITGSEEDINAMNKKDLELVYDTFYQPNNMFIIITGSFNPYKMSSIIKENQRKKKFKLHDYKIIRQKEDVTVKKEQVYLKEEVAIPKISLCYKMSRKRFKEYNNYILSLYLDIIFNANFGPTSNLKEDLLEKELIYSLSYNIDVDDDLIVIKLSSQTNYPNEVINILQEYIEKLNITEDRLKRRKKCNMASLIMGLDDIEYINNLILEDIIKYNKINNDAYNICQKIDIDIANKIIKHIDLNNCSQLIMDSKGK